MSTTGFFRGTSAEQDSRFSNKEKKLRRELKFPPHFDKKVDMSRVNLDVIKIWIRERLSQLLGFDDDVLIGMVENLLEAKNLDPRDMQIQITAFLEKKAGPFMSDLWQLLVSAMESDGIPKEILERKKEELRQKKLEEDRLQEELMRKQEEAHQQRQAQDVIDAIRVQVETISEKRRLENSAATAAQGVVDPSLQVIQPGTIARKKQRKSKWDNDEPIGTVGVPVQTELHTTASPVQPNSDDKTSRNSGTNGEDDTRQRRSSRSTRRDDEDRSDRQQRGDRSRDRSRDRSDRERQRKRRVSEEEERRRRRHRDDERSERSEKGERGEKGEKGERSKRRRDDDSDNDRRRDRRSHRDDSEERSNPSRNRKRNSSPSRSRNRSPEKRTSRSRRSGSVSSSSSSDSDSSSAHSRFRSTSSSRSESSVSSKASSTGSKSKRSKTNVSGGGDPKGDTVSIEHQLREKALRAQVTKRLNQRKQSDSHE